MLPRLGCLVSRSTRRSALQVPLLRIGTRSVVTSTVDWKPVKTSRTPDDEPKNSSFGKKIVLGLMIAMPVVAFYLGTWQYRRLDWKNKLIATCEGRLTHAPVTLPKKFTLDMCEHWEYRKVLLKGHYVYDQEMFVGPKVRNGQKGYILFTPFIREDTGEKMLVERGWIDEEKILPDSRTLQHLSLPRGTLEITCLVRMPKKRTNLQWEKEDRNSRLWNVPDVFAMAEASGSNPAHLQVLYDLKDHPYQQISEEPSKIANTSSSWKLWQKWGTSQDEQPLDTPQVINTNSNSQKLLSRTLYQDDETVEFSEWQFMKAGVPIGVQPKVTFKNNHLQYMMTWYGLAFLSSIFLVVALVKTRNGSAVSQAQLKRDKLKHAKRYM